MIIEHINFTETPDETNQGLKKAKKWKVENS